MPKRKICVVTGSRAEYGLLYWLMKGIRKDAGLALQLAVTGAHLSPEFGLTYREIEKDGFRIDAKVEMLLSSDSPGGVAKSLGLAAIGFSDALARLNPDVMVVLGDRYEILAAVSVALVLGIPVAHISGGEVTEGAVDDSIRHAVTKMAHLHFPATEAYRRRILQLGEDPRRVFVVGDPGVESVERLGLLSRREWSRRTGFELQAANVAVTFHPATAEAEAPAKQFREILEALTGLSDGTSIVFTRPNADAGGRELNAMIDEFVAKRPDRRAAFTSLGQLLYLSLIKNSRALVGNSSSGITEAPSLKVPTVDVGDRQKGRLSAASVLHCRPTAGDIGAALRRAMAMDCSRVRNPYGGGDVSGRILTILKRVPLSGLARKKFHDLSAR